MTPDDVVERIMELFRAKGEQHYGEQVTQREHALQTALLAQQAGESPSLVVACLLHDVGHLLATPPTGSSPSQATSASSSPDSPSSPESSTIAIPTRGLEKSEAELAAPADGDDDLLHEEQGARWLQAFFPEEITEPIRLHVAAKRYLCWKDSSYYEGLSVASRLSLRLQGGPMTASEAAEFIFHPQHEAALRLRWFDDQGKAPDLELPQLEEYRAEIVKWVQSG